MNSFASRIMSGLQRTTKGAHDRGRYARSFSNRVLKLRYERQTWGVLTYTQKGARGWDSHGRISAGMSYLSFRQISTIACTLPSCGLIIWSIPLCSGALLKNVAMFSSGYAFSTVVVSPL